MTNCLKSCANTSILRSKTRTRYLLCQENELGALEAPYQTDSNKKEAPTWQPTWVCVRILNQPAQNGRVKPDMILCDDSEQLLIQAEILMSVLEDSICSGCGLSMPARDNAAARSYYNTSAECWDLYTEVLGTEYSNAFLFGQIHQLTVDAYAVQHAGGPHPDKSVDVHLFGLYLSLEKGVRSPYVPPLLQRLATDIKVWPHYEPPTKTASLTVFDVAISDSVGDHIRVVREWARGVWECWAKYHANVASLISQHLKAG